MLSRHIILVSKRIINDIVSVSYDLKVHENLKDLMYDIISKEFFNLKNRSTNIFCSNFLTSYLGFYFLGELISKNFIQNI